MSNIEKHDVSALGQFGALTSKQHAMVNVFLEMVRRVQVPMPRGAWSHNQGNLPLEKGDKVKIAQAKDPRGSLGHE